MSRHMIISGLLIIVAFAAAFACLAMTPEDNAIQLAAKELENQAMLEQLVRMKLI